VDETEPTLKVFWPNYYWLGTTLVV